MNILIPIRQDSFYPQATSMGCKLRVAKSKDYGGAIDLIFDEIAANKTVSDHLLTMDSAQISKAIACLLKVHDWMSVELTRLEELNEYLLPVLIESTESKLTITFFDINDKEVWVKRSIGVSKDVFCYGVNALIDK